MWRYTAKNCVNPSAAWSQRHRTANATEDIDSNRFPLRELIAFRRQHLQGRAIDLGKQTGTTSFTLAKAPLIEFLKQPGNSFVQLRDTEKLTVPQRGDYPALGN